MTDKMDENIYSNITAGLVKYIFLRLYMGNKKKEKKEKEMMKCQVVILDKRSQEKVKQVTSLSNYSGSELYSHEAYQLPSTPLPQDEIASDVPMSAWHHQTSFSGKCIKNPKGNLMRK